MSTFFNTRARTVLRSLAIACLSVGMVAGAQAQGHGGGRGGGGHYYGHGGYGHGGYYGHGGGYGRGLLWGGLGLGIGLGLGSYYYGGPGYYVSDPGYVVVDPPVVYSSPQPVPVQSAPVPSRSTQPVIYPRNGQSAAQLDADSNACSQWAGAQPNATNDGGVFRRGIQACMDARGYTVR